jgi:hypothetical protein
MAKQPARIKVTVGGGWKPRLFFWLLVAALLLLAVAELLNVMKRPSLTYLKGPAGANGLVLYQKGRAANREAWLLTEPQAESGPPVCFMRIDCTVEDQTTGDLRWSFDGLALYATRRKVPSIDAADRPLWVYEFNAAKLWSLKSEPPIEGFPATPGTEAALVDIINRHGGKGPVAATWYDLGKRGDYLFAWQITRWEKVLPVLPEKSMKPAKQPGRASKDPPHTE